MFAQPGSFDGQWQGDGAEHGALRAEEPACSCTSWLLHLLARRASSERAVGRVLLGCLALYVAAFLPLANLPAESFFRPILARFWMQVPHPCMLACVACLHVPRRLAHSDASDAPHCGRECLLPRGGEAERPRWAAGDEGNGGGGDDKGAGMAKDAQGYGIALPLCLASARLRLMCLTRAQHAMRFARGIRSRRGALACAGMRTQHCG